MARFTVEDADSIVAACRTEAVAMSVAVSVVVVDAVGEVISAVRMDNANSLSMRIAEAKAYTAATMRRDSADVADRFSDSPVVLTSLSILTNGQILPIPGGVVLKGSDDEPVLGAIGVSGSSTQTDVQIATVGRGTFRDQ